MTSERRDETPITLRGARVVLPDRVAGRATVVVERGRVARVVEGETTAADENARPGEGATPSEGAPRDYDLRGLTLYPGFIDVHVHGGVGVDALAASADDLARVAAFLARRGVTSWLPTLVPAPDEDYRRAVASIEALIARQRDEPERGDGDGDIGARALGVHYEGPYVNAAQCGALRTAYFRDNADRSPAALDPLVRLTQPLAPRAYPAHMITVAPEIAGGVDLVDTLVKNGWIVSIGHTRAEVGVLDSARAAGARHMTHFFNAMSPLHHRDLGVVGWGLLRDDVTCDIIADCVHVSREALRLALRVKTPERLTLISDAVLPARKGDGDYQVWGETISVVGGRTRNARGSIAGSVITMLEAARTMRWLGCEPYEVARMASLNPARLIGFDRELGSVEEGKRADLVALDDEGQARLTLVGGRVAHKWGLGVGVK
ncbi:MAG: N-acetylglucosamine-6-phosphate deacetylase [Pyrinomonadaceae bacterium]